MSHVNHALLHPNVYHASGNWSEDQTLYVATCYNNPCRWNARRNLMNDFRRHMQTSANVELYVGELAYDSRAFEVTSLGHPRDLRFRTRQILWHKENLLNRIISAFPPDWKYGAIIDADFQFCRHDWALEAVHQLQLHDFIQLFSSYSDMDSDHIPGPHQFGFAFNWCQKARPNDRPTKYAWLGSPGGAWAFRREAFEKVGGLLDICILGSADYHMANGLIGEQSEGRDLTYGHNNYARAIQAWQKRAATLGKNIGYLPCHAIHHFHGRKSQRGYSTRWQILRDWNFDPMTDLFRDSQGLWQLTAEKPGLTRALLDYFKSRNEDAF